MYRNCDTKNGIPPRVYREPREIRDDIKAITEKIEETSSMLNIREILVNMLMEDNKDAPENLIFDLEDAIMEAKAAIKLFKELNEELTSLEEELEEVKWLKSGKSREA